MANNRVNFNTSSNIAQNAANNRVVNPAERKMLGQRQVAETREILEEEKVFRKGSVSILDLIAPSAFKVEANHICIGDKFARTLFVVSYPRYIHVGWFAPIINFPAALDISMFFYPVESSIVLNQLKKKVGVLEAEISEDRDKGAPRDPIKETALRDIEQLRDDLTQGIEHFFQYALYVTIYADTLEELNNLTEDIENFFGGRLVYTKKVLYQAEQGFNSTLPLGNDELGISCNMNSSPAASSFPFISTDLTSDKGIMYGINQHNNSLIIFDRFSLQNANMTVFATSGAGKSYAIKLEILRSLMLGVDVIVIDPEKEYKHLCDAVGGSFVNISLSSESKLNPFDLPRPKDDDYNVEDIIRTAVIVLKGLVRLMLGELTHQEDSIIDRALLETFAKKDITAATNLNEITPPLLQDFQQILEGIVGAEDLVLRLRKYTEGTFAGLLNNYTNVDINNQLVIFSVRDLEDELRPIAIYTIVNYIWSVIRSERKKRILVVDEAWWLIQHEDSAKFMFALVKRCRKYYLGVTTITQDVSDFLNSPYGRPILNNSALQLLLKQAKASIEEVHKTFMLTEGEKYLLLECGVGEGIFFAGNRHAAIKVVASYTEDQLITSDPQQLMEIEEEKKKFEDNLMQERGQNSDGSDI